MVGVTNFLKSRREKTLSANASMTAFSNIYFSGTTFTLWRKARVFTQTYSKGLVLDAGSGHGGWRDYIEQNAERREALDWQAREGESLDWIADLTDMPQVPSDRFDAAICHQVMEHISKPRNALKEIHRVMKPGAHLVMSVPHLSRLHELPHDYYRYTPQGLKIIAEQCGFEPITIQTYGGLATFIHHQISTVFIGLASITRPTALIATGINAPFTLLAAGVDHLIDRNSFMPNGIIAVLRKPAEI